MLNYLLDSKSKGLKLHGSKSCGNVKLRNVNQQNDEEEVKEDEILLSNNNEWPEEIPNIDVDKPTALIFNDKQLVTEEQFNQAFILNVSFFWGGCFNV